PGGWNAISAVRVRYRTGHCRICPWLLSSRTRVSLTPRVPQQDTVLGLRWSESSEEHLPTSIAGVLRLRALKPSVCDRSANRFAQDDGFVRGLGIQLVGYAENTLRTSISRIVQLKQHQESNPQSPRSSVRCRLNPGQQTQRAIHSY